MDKEKLQDKCRGSLVGGAIGDALGYEVEFMSWSAIRKQFGEKGINRYVLHNDVAEFSDDTQMALFTLEGLINGINTTGTHSPKDLLPYIEKAYINWYRTQTESPKLLPDSNLSRIPTLFSRRAPGMTCMGALEKLSEGKTVWNMSKGCGGVMRVAPIGLWGGIHPDQLNIQDVAVLAGKSAEITHKHIASTFSSALLAVIVAKCLDKEMVDRDAFERIVMEGLKISIDSFPGHKEEENNFSLLINKAIRLGKSNKEEKEAIKELGEGWVGDEAIAIAIFSVMRHISDFEACIICAVNHDGDSDSTGAIAGNIIGSILGYSAIPPYYLSNLEILPEIVRLADEIYCE